MKTIEILRNAAMSNNFSKNTRSYLQQLSQCGYVRTGYYQGSGRHTRAIDDTNMVVNALRTLHIAHAQGNDAPRGGVSGNYVIITSEAVMKEIGKTGNWQTLRKNAGREWKYIKQHPYTHAELLAHAESRLSWVNKEDENDEDGRYWISAYHGCGVYELVIKDGRIAASLAEGFHWTRPTADNRITPTREEWIAALSEVVTAHIGTGFHWAKADGSGTYFYLRDEEDAELLQNVREYDVPDMMHGGLHHNIEIR